MKYSLKVYFGTLSADEWEKSGEMGLRSKEINEKELFKTIQEQLAGGDRELTLAVVRQMMSDGTLDEEFLLAAGIN